MTAVDGARTLTGPPTTVTVRYFAAARAAAGTDQEALEFSGGRPTRVGDVIEGASERHGEVLSRVLARCSYLLNATAVHDLTAPVNDGDQLDVLPPFAGG